MPLQLRNVGWIVVMLCATTVIAQTTKSADDGRIADFESLRTVAVDVPGAKVTTETEGAAQGERFLRIARPNERATVRFGVPKSTSFVGREQFVAQVRASEPANLIWSALDEHDRQIFVRSVKIDAGDAWKRLELPLHTWRWPSSHPGDWDEVRRVAIRIDSKGVDHIDLDDLRVEQSAPADERTSFLLDLAFEKRERKVADRGEFLIATDAADAFRDADLQRWLDDFSNARKFIRRIFGDAVRPIEQITSPPMLLIFSREEARGEFFKRLNDAWDAKINVGKAQGFTVQDIATATYVQTLGVRRPVYLHEAVHAIVSRDLRVLPGHEAQGTLQEAIATYVQLCVFPTAIAPDIYPKAFAQPVDGKGIFKPLETLMKSDATSKDYA